MPHEFEVREEIVLDATPEQVWEAIATGPGIDCWFMGRNEVEPGEGGRTRMTMGGHTEESTITAWEPGRRFAHRSAESPEGTFMAFEYLIEGRGQGSTVLRFVHNGFLGDSWEAEFDALKVGDRMYLEKLAIYLKHFAGRRCTFTMLAHGAQVPDGERVWAVIRSALGLTGAPAVGDPVRLGVDGVAPAEGTVAYVRPPYFLGVRTSDALFMFMHAQDTVVVEEHSFDPGIDGDKTEQAWNAWLRESFA